MFKTAIRDDDNPERVIKTSSPSNSKRFRVSYKKPVEREQQFPNESTLRPFTTQVVSPKVFDTLNTTGKTTKLVNMRTIDVVESELSSEFKKQMCGYLRKKLRHMVGKRQEDLAYSRYLNNTIENGELENTSHSSMGPLDQFYSTFNQKNKPKIEKGVDGAYVSNAKEHILRLIHRKREQQGDYTQVSKSIKTRHEDQKQKKCKSLVNQFKVPLIQRQSWDKEWKQSVSSEKKRYRNRLLMKSNRENNHWMASFTQ